MNIHDIEVERIDGSKTKLSAYAGKTLLIVNVASECGYTPQYKGLNELYQKHKDRGLVVLGFPCNQFGAQEPGSNQEIAAFCDREFKVAFPMFAKIEVNGPGEHPLFKALKAAKPGDIKWNFGKFLVGKDGAVLERWASRDTPEAIEQTIAKALSAQ